MPVERNERKSEENIPPSCPGADYFCEVIFSYSREGVEKKQVLGAYRGVVEVQFNGKPKNVLYKLKHRGTLLCMLSKSVALNISILVDKACFGATRRSS